MNGIAHTIDDKQHIDYHHTRHMTTVSYPIHSYHPYERLGSEMKQAIFSLCEYNVDYASHSSHDRLVTYRSTGYGQ